MLRSNYKIAYLIAGAGFNLDDAKPSAEGHFMASAILVEQAFTAPLSDFVQKIREKEFGGGELKSAGVDHGRRFRILRMLLKQPFSVFYLVIDGENIYFDGGVDAQDALLNYVNKLFYKALADQYQSLKIVFGAEQKAEFPESFQAYVQRETGVLFSPYQFYFEKQSQSNLLQLADFIAGTLALGYGEAVSRHYRAYLNFLQDKIVYGRVFPRKYTDYLHDETQAPGRYDRKIATWCVNAALDYLRQHEHSTVLEELNRVIVLDRLLFQLQLDASQYLGTGSLKQLIKTTSGFDYTNQQFRANIIAPLRDAGVIISSSPQGYKIPLTLAEVYSYSNHTMQVVYPMLERLGKCRDSILKATGNELDIIDTPEHQSLKAYFKHLPKDP